jgi:hypothetical protein
MSSFISITQYDKQFDVICKETKKGFACSYFAILTAWNYLNNYKYDKQSHENNIKNAIIFSELIGESHGINFETLITNYTDLNNNSIIGTTSELIKTNIIGYDQIFPNNCDIYAVILLKNEKYIVIMKYINEYYIRDCHENVQYNFKSLNQLIEVINELYQFDKQIDIGIDMSNYSSVEFLIIKNKFKIDIIKSLLNLNDEKLLTIDDNMKFNESNKNVFNHTELLEKQLDNNFDNIMFTDIKINTSNDVDIIYFE